MSRYRPSGCASQAAALLVSDLRVRRESLDPETKKGFTLLSKRGLVRRCSREVARGYGGGVVYRPGPGFWDAAEQWGMTQDGYALAEVTA